MAYRAHWLGPAFAVAALIAPGVIALFGATSLLYKPPWLSAQAIFAQKMLSLPQYALLTIGLSAAVVSGALATYRWSLSRRLLHLFLFSILLELFYRFAYGGAVSPGILLSVPETSGRETGELLAGHGILTVSLTVVALLASCALVASWRSQVRFSAKRCLQLGAASAAMIFASLLMGEYQFGEMRILKPVLVSEVQDTFPFDIAAAFDAVAGGLIHARRLARTRAAFEFPNVSLVNAAARGADPEIYVVVIGETSRRANWSLFGYSRDTTPRLDAIKDELYLFKHVTSNATNTVLSVPLTLTRATPATGDVVRSEKSVITLLRQAGFETFWISNQERSDALFNPISQIALEADHVSFPRDMQPGESSFDGNLLVRLDEEMTRLPANAKAVIFLHMEGSHFGYKERYPAGFSQFRGGRGAPRSLPAREMRLVDEYDNSVYYTDNNLRGIIDRLALCRCKTGLIFFSDHGERLFDHGLKDSDFGHGFPTVSRQEVEVPFFVWLSNAYRAENPLLVARLEANEYATVELHNLFETIVDLTGIDYENRNASLSLFSEDLRTPAQLEVLNMNEEPVSLSVLADDGARPRPRSEPPDRPTIAGSP
jgi:glucan phosphoethanolaminetransferase (alkaline phosphatase superfamily)